MRLEAFLDGIRPARPVSRLAKLAADLKPIAQQPVVPPVPTIPDVQKPLAEVPPAPAPAPAPNPQWADFKQAWSSKPQTSWADRHAYGAAVKAIPDLTPEQQAEAQQIRQANWKAPSYVEPGKPFNRAQYLADLQDNVKADPSLVAEQLDLLKGVDPATGHNTRLAAQVLLGRQPNANALETYQTRLTGELEGDRAAIQKGGDLAQRDAVKADLQPAIQDAVAARYGIPRSALAGAVNNPMIPEGIRQGMAGKMGITPEDYQSAKAIFGTDPKTFQEEVTRLAADKGQKVAATIRQMTAPQPKLDAAGQPVVGPDGKPVMESKAPSIMDVLKSDPTSWLAPAGLILALFGGRMGAIMGTLMMAGGGYRLYDRFNQVKSGGGAKVLQGMHALAEQTGDKSWADPSVEGIDRFLQSDGAKAMGFDPSLRQTAIDTAALVQRGTDDFMKNQGQQAGQQFASGLFDDWGMQAPGAAQ